MIRSFGDRQTERIWDGQYIKTINRGSRRAALRKLELLHAAAAAEDLRIPPGNRPERLKGDRKGQYSVRVSDQWRICFVWKDGGADDVELVDYR